MNILHTLLQTPPSAAVLLDDVSHVLVAGAAPCDTWPEKTPQTKCQLIIALFPSLPQNISTISVIQLLQLSDLWLSLTFLLISVRELHQAQAKVTTGGEEFPVFHSNTIDLMKHKSNKVSVTLDWSVWNEMCDPSWALTLNIKPWWDQEGTEELCHLCLSVLLTRLGHMVATEKQTDGVWTTFRFKVSKALSMNHTERKKT